MAVPGGPRRLPTRGCWCSTSRWPPSSAWTRPGCGARTACGCWSATSSRRGHAGGAGLRRAPVRLVTPRVSGDGRALLLGELVDADGRRPRPAPQGLRAHAVRARRRRPGRGRSDAARVRRQRGDARPRHPHDPLPGRGGDRPPGAPRDRAAGRRARPGREQPPARGQLPVRRGHGRRRPAAPPRRPRDQPAPPGRRGRREPLPRAVRGGGRRPGVAGRPVDARRVRPRGDEHRQHDDLRRDHRLRAVRVHGGLRPGHGLQLDRRGRALRLRQPAGRGGVEPRPARRGSPAPLRTTTRSRRSRSRWSRSARSAGSTAPPGRPACGPSSACPTASTTR